MINTRGRRSEMQVKDKQNAGNKSMRKASPRSSKSAARMRVDYLLNDEGDDGKVGSTIGSTGGSRTPKSVMWGDLGEGGIMPKRASTQLSTMSLAHSSGRKSKVYASAHGQGHGRGQEYGRGQGYISTSLGAGDTNGQTSLKEKKFECELCGFAFGMKSNLKRHIMTVHEDRRLWRCNICGASFGLKQNLGTHVRVKHEKRRPFACDTCGVSFGYKQVLQNHRRNIHGKDE